MTEIRSVEASGADVETAIARGLEELGVGRDAVEIEVLDEGSRGLFLGIGAREARVRLTLKARQKPEKPPRPRITAQKAKPAATPIRVTGDESTREAEVGKAVLEELLDKMQIRARVEVYRAEVDSPDEVAPWVLDVRGRDLGVLIGRRGETLAALQYITRLITGRELQRYVGLVVDVEGYKVRRARQLRQLAHRMANEAVRRRRTISLEPMPPYERRIVHLALRDRGDVRTESVGEGPSRRVTIIPQRRRG